MICPKCNIDDKFGCDCVPDEFQGDRFKVSVGNREYLVKKRYFAFTGSALLETDDFDLPRDQWSECELLPVEIVGGNKPIMIVGSISKAGMVGALLQGMGHDVICIDEAPKLDSVVTELVFRAEPMETLEGFRARHGLPGKKGRRRGQRQNDRKW